jgi:plasmid maintenance system antidote protein VapI
MRPRNGEQLSEAMWEAGFDTVRLGQQIGVSRQYLAMLIAGKRGCKHSTAAAIAKAVGLPVTTLFIDLSYENSYNETEADVTVITEEEDPWLLFPEVCKLTRTEPGTMRQHRTAGDGPPFFKHGRVLKCRKSKAIAWMEAQEKASLAAEQVAK